MRSFLLRCYPASWRARYGDEFAAVLDERPLGPFDVLDILLGALDAQLRLRRGGIGSTVGRGLIMSLRVGGIAAVLGALLVGLTALLSVHIPGEYDDFAEGVLFFVGVSLLIVGMAGLGAFQARAQPQSAWTAFILPIVGVVAIVFADIWRNAVDPDRDGAFAGDQVVMILTWAGAIAAFVGFAWFAVVTYRSAVLSRAGAVLLGAAPVLLVIAVVVMAAAWDLSVLLFFAAVISFVAGWLLLGVQAIRQGANATTPGLA